MATQLSAPVAAISFAAPDSTARRVWIAAAIVSLLLIGAINSSSIWIDEGFSAWMSGHRSLGDVVETLRSGDPSDRQMPLHYFYLWTWARVFGLGEYSMRAANIPFGILFVFALAWASRVALRSNYGWIAAALSPFVWFYMNEGRAYMMLMGFAAAGTAAVLVYAFGDEPARRRAPWIAVAFLWLAWLTHMLAGFLLPAFAVIVFFSNRRAGPRFATWWRDWRRPLLVSALPFAALAAYYASTLHTTTAYEYGRPSWAHFGLVLYEYTGFGGLGPPRNALRDQQLGQAFASYWPWVTTGVLTLLCLIGDAIRRGIRRETAILTAAWTAAFACAIAASFYIDMRFVGRHLAAVMPLLLFALISLVRDRRRWIVPLALWVVADFRYAALDEYKKDDYRGASHFVAEEAQRSGARIAWAADPLTAYYYGLALKDEYRAGYYEFEYAAAVKLVSWPTRAQGDVVANWNPAQSAALLAKARRDGVPILLALSKPDLYDVHGGWKDALDHRPAECIARFRSFEIYLIR